MPSGDEGLRPKNAQGVFQGRGVLFGSRRRQRFVPERTPRQVAAGALVDLRGPRGVLGGAVRKSDRQVHQPNAADLSGQAG